uniref:Neuropathy target esterase sws n=1 Tax=Strigamia maritima TaxID=126957 RepID=T1IXP6_STRMM
MFVGIVLVVLILAFVIFRKLRKKVPNVKEFVGVGSTKPRFRKRDKVMFYGRKIIRKVRSISGQVRGGERRLKKRQIVLKFARRILRIRKDASPQSLQVKEPSLAYLEADYSDHAEQRLPPEVMYMLKSIRVFGNFEKPLFLELCKHLEQRFLSPGEYLFTVGQEDDSIYVVQSGKLAVSIVEQDGIELPLKQVTTGESVISLLTFVDVLTGQPSYFKTISAKAVEATIVVRLPLHAFRSVFERYQESLVRVVQIIMVRLQRVSFTALYHYLGLTTQLINPGCQAHRKASAPAIPLSPKASPNRAKEILKPSFGGASTDETTASTEPHTEPEESQSNTEMEPTTSTARNVRISLNENEFFKIAGSSKHAANELRKRKTRSVHDAPDRALLHEADDIDYMVIAQEGFTSQLGLDDSSMLNDRVELKDLQSGTYLVKQESLIDASLVYILTGSLLMSQRLIDKDEETQLYVAYAGELVGGLSILSGEPSYFTVRARQTSKVAVINKINFYAIMRERPQIVLHVATSIVQRLSSFVRQIDFALDWMNVEAGKSLYRQGDTADCTYIVLSGRLRSVITRVNGKKELVGEYGRGDLVGIVELLTETERSTSVMAVRDTELAKLPEGLLNAIKIKYPVVMYRLMHLLGHGILGSWQKSSLPLESRPSTSNFSTVAVVPVNDDVPLTPFTLELYHSANSIGQTLHLTSDLVRKMLGPSIFESVNEYRLSSWLGQQEDHHKIVLYQCDYDLSPWTKRCIRQADVILFIALADQPPSVGRYEKHLESFAVRTQKELVLLHKEEGKKPTNTVQWLNIRSWCSSHHHIRCPKRMFTRKSQAKIMEMYKKQFENPPNIHSDFCRLARFLTGTSIGLVLGGGGARGASHVGMIRAIQEAGIPIDMVGGVSIGAFMGGLWCNEQNLTTFTQKAREWSFKMTSVWRQILDLTYPSTAMFTGDGFNKLIQGVFGDVQIEDLWLPYFAITTDITSSCMRIHTHGSLWRYARASMSLSGYLPPLCDPEDGHLLLDGGYINNLPGSVWRYIRASMSICGLLPPLCDPEDGHLLVDGAYVDNLPADVMRNMGAHVILAIDVGSQDDTDLTNYGDKLSGWWLLMKRWNPWTTPVKVPNLPEIQSRLAYVSCVRQLEEVKRSDYCEYIRPPIDNFKTLQFGSFDEIRDVGYNYGKKFFCTWESEGTIPSLIKCERAVGKSTLQHQMSRSRDASFTDLAEMICRIKQPNKMPLFDEFSDEDYEDDDLKEEGYVSEPGASGMGDKEAMSPMRIRRTNSLSETELIED